MTITFAAERFDVWLADAAHILPGHWLEALPEGIDIPLEVDWDLYTVLEHAGILRVWVARTETREVVGFWGGFLMPCSRSKSIRTAITEFYWVAPAWRHFVPLRLFKTLLAYLAGEGVQLMHIEGRGQVERLFRHLGFQPSGTNLFKVIEAC